MCALCPPCCAYASATALEARPLWEVGQANSSLAFEGHRNARARGQSTRRQQSDSDVAPLRRKNTKNCPLILFQKCNKMKTILKNDLGIPSNTAVRKSSNRMHSSADFATLPCRGAFHSCFIAHRPPSLPLLLSFPAFNLQLAPTSSTCFQSFTLGPGASLPRSRTFPTSVGLKVLSGYWSLTA